MRVLIFTLLFCLVGCSQNQRPPRASIVTPQLERVQQQVNQTRDATERVVEKVEVVRVSYPDDTNIKELTSLAIDARDKATALKDAYEKVKVRIQLVEEENIELEEHVYKSEKKILVLEKKLAKWRLNAFVMGGAFLVALTLLVKPWRWFMTGGAADSFLIMNELKKETFLQGVRQKWAAVLIACMFAVLGVNVYNPNLDMAGYLTFMTTVGTSFILGLTATSYAKTQAAKSKQDKELDAVKSKQDKELDVEKESKIQEIAQQQLDREKICE
jgi:predicted phage tail protein